MSIYQLIAEFGSKFIAKNKLFKFGFNYSPMYRRSTAKITEVAEDLLSIKIKLPISYKNKNYVGSIFGGSMFAAVDPIPMVQLINLLETDYIVWDKSAEINFKSPAREDLYAEFSFTTEELDAIKRQVDEKHAIEIVKTTRLANKQKTKTYCEINKTLYITTKSFYHHRKNRPR